MIMAAAIIIIYYIVDPSQSRWMPKCPSKLITGFDCPSCGSQRALHAVLHGDINAAWNFNPFLFIALPYLLLALWGQLSFIPGSARANRLACSPILVFGYIGIFLAWWLLRNLL